jgi:hypothetical protein
MRAFFYLLAGLGALVWLGWWLLLIFAVLIAVVAAYVWRLHREKLADDRRREQRALCAGANQQQAWLLAGDPRGLYGDYPPAC